ncbi:MAG: hypothetical protein EBZ48_04280 [Proteobacteria bacterium]|nr:hypothetical protein [Pseudomonadota bacterium]
MHQHISSGLFDLSSSSLPSAQRQPANLAPQSPEDKLANPGGAGMPPQRLGQKPGEDSPDSKDKSAWVAPRLEVSNKNGSIEVSVEHPMRDVLEQLGERLAQFISANMRPSAPIGLTSRSPERVEMAKLVAELKCGFRELERNASVRGDGLGPSLVVRRVASEASALVEHMLIDLIATRCDGRLPEGEVQEVLHTLTTLKHGLRQLIQQFDVLVIQELQESGRSPTRSNAGKSRPPA